MWIDATMRAYEWHSNSRALLLRDVYLGLCTSLCDSFIDPVVGGRREMFENIFATSQLGESIFDVSASPTHTIFRQFIPDSLPRFIFADDGRVHFVTQLSCTIGNDVYGRFNYVENAVLFFVVQSKLFLWIRVYYSIFALYFKQNTFLFCCVDSLHPSCKFCLQLETTATSTFPGCPHLLTKAMGAGRG